MIINFGVIYILSAILVVRSLKIGTIFNCKSDFDSKIIDIKILK